MRPFPKWGHVVSIADSGVVWGWRWRGQKQFYKTVKKSARMHKLHPLKENMKFGNEQAVMEKAFTGIILKHQTSKELYVLTAGHVYPGEGNAKKYRFALYDFLKRYDPPRSYEYKWWMPIRYNLWGSQLMIASYGGARTPDFAICKLSREHSNSMQGYKITAEDMEGIPNYGQEEEKSLEVDFEPEYYFYPNGLGLKTASHKVTTMNRGKMWEGSPYIYCPLLVTEGCSGTPVFHKVEVEEEGEKKVVDRFLGIVVAKGNAIPDFNQKGEWQFDCKEGYNGTKILTLEGIRSYLYSLTEHPGWKYGKGKRTLEELKKLFPEPNEDLIDLSWWEKELNPADTPDREGKLTGSESLYVSGHMLKYVSGEEGDWSIDLSDDGPVSLAFDGLNFRVYKRTKLIDDPTDSAPNPDPNFEDIACGSVLKKLDWPIAETQPQYGMHLRFREDIQMKGWDVFPEQNRVVALEGIGTMEGIGEMDIIDELPHRYCQRLQRAWICDGHFIELSVHEGKYIRVRHVDGMVDVYSQAFKPKFRFKKNPNQKAK